MEYKKWLTDYAPPSMGFFHKTALFFLIEPTPNLKQYYNYPQVSYTEDHLPANLVIIIGESLSRTHCSLNGYSKPTNSRLEELVEQKVLYVFDSISAPAIQTVPAFKFFMTESNRENAKDKEWFKCLTIPEVFHTLGYKMQWISNQKRSGFYDNVCTRFAELCDTMYFVNDNNNAYTSYYDESLLPLLKKSIPNFSGRNLYFLHLMGSHPLYKERYPSTFSKFSSDDYMDLPEHQRNTIAEYDTSVAYNDSVISEIIDIFSQKESVVVYFSDHGQDLYQSDSHYCGHANRTIKSQKFGKEIPFIVYLSPKFQEKNPMISGYLNNNRQSSFCTENLIYFLMDLVGANFKDNERVQENTLLKIK